jgi:glucuronokinase
LACEATAHARAGLIGNPSDGYFGKTISISVRNFSARVSVYESEQLELVPSIRDRSQYPGLRELVDDVKAYGYYGGIRLMKATIRRFSDYCDERGITLSDRNFSIRYRSSIPRHVGLAGSSALVTAAIRCLMEFYEVEIPKPELPNLILSVESAELGISAGLQDRVIQVYEGLVYMDFDKGHMEQHGFGRYVEMDPGLLPSLFIAYRTDFSEGSEVFHNRIRERWLDGDLEIVQAMQDFAGYAEEVRKLLDQGRGDAIGPWLDRNFDRRMSIAKLNPADIDMVMRARKAGAHAKFAGSGGAIVGVYDGEDQYLALMEAYEGTGIQVVKPMVRDHGIF